MTSSTSEQIKKVAPTWDLAETKRIVLEQLAPYQVTVYLFGSRANATMSKTSDIDVAVLSEHPLPVGILSSIREKLEGSNIIYRVDIVDLNEVSSDFRKKVLKEGVQWKG